MAIVLMTICLIFLYKGSLAAQDFGVRGHTFPIVEEDFSAFIQHRLKKLTQQDISNLQSRINEHYESLIKQPRPVDNLTETKVYRTFTFDPSITVSTDITDHENQTIIKKGTFINPLSICPMREDLLLFDGTNQKHIKWAKEQKKDARWILVKGRPTELEEQEQRTVFFDQFGFLTTKLGILHIPAKVYQNSELLQIDEIPLNN